MLKQEIIIGGLIMRGKKAFGVLVVMMGLTLVGCSTNKNDITNTNVTAIESESTDSKNDNKMVESKDNTSNVATTDTNKEASNESNSDSIVWEEITLTLPSEWKDKVIIMKDDNGVKIYQKSSYEKNESGFMYGIYKTNEYTNNFAGERIIAFTDDTIYVATSPTDVACYCEDEAIMNEYIELLGKANELSKSLKIARENVQFNVEEYVIPTSSTILLTKEALVDFNDNDLWLARNEIYARHGRKFNNYYLQNYFQACSWYEEADVTSFDEASLSKTEKSNIALIKELEDQYKQEHIYPMKQNAGTKVQCDLNGDGNLETVSYVPKIVKTQEQDYEEVQPILKVEGKSYNLCDMNIYMENPVIEEFYITDISTYIPGLEIALLASGPSEDPETYFFTYDKELHFIGSITGFPFKDLNFLNGFAEDGSVMGIIRTDLIESCMSYASWYYDYDNKQLKFQDVGYYKIIPENAHELYLDIPIYEQMDVSSLVSTLKAQKQVYFLGTDGKEWIKVRGKDGNSGYVHIVDGKVATISNEITEVFSELNYYD